jgi:hypothetical protein
MLDSSMTTEDKKRFMSKVRIPTLRHDVCWEWAAGTRGQKSRPYGAFSYNGKRVLAHRFAYEAYMGTIPEGLLVLHKCDNRLCVRPSHLFLGTNQENMDDRMAKGRWRVNVAA